MLKGIDLFQNVLSYIADGIFRGVWIAFVMLLNGVGSCCCFYSLAQLWWWLVSFPSRFVARYCCLFVSTGFHVGLTRWPSPLLILFGCCSIAKASRLARLAHPVVQQAPLFRRTRFCVASPAHVVLSLTYLLVVGKELFRLQCQPSHWYRYM